MTGLAVQQDERSNNGVVIKNPRITVVVLAGEAGPKLSSYAGDLLHTFSEAAEIVVVTDTPWSSPPKGIVSVASNSISRGDRLDLASQHSRGELVAFVEEGTRLTEAWLNRVFEIFADQTIGAAGGPHLVPAEASVGQRAAWILLSSLAGSGPLRRRYKRCQARPVREMPTTNLVVRRDALRAVGGFQSPSKLGDDARLCYKLRSLLGLKVLHDPDLGIYSAPPALPQPFLSLMLEWGHQRGDLLRRLPETSERLPYVLPTLLLTSMLLVVGLSPFSPFARAILGMGIAAYLVASIGFLIRARNLRVGLTAAAALPGMHLAYGFGLLTGYLGSSLAEISPRPYKAGPLRILIMNWRDITHPWFGGAEIYMHQLAVRWVRQGSQVGWLSERYRVGRQMELIDGIRFHRVGGRYTLYPFAAVLYALRLRSRYDVIVDCQNGIPFFSPLYSRKPVALTVFHVHHEVFRRELPTPLSRLACWSEDWLMPRVYRSNEVVTISQSSASELQARKYSNDRISIVSPGVDLPEDADGQSRSQTPLIVCLGRLKGYKGVDVLLKAMPVVRDQLPDVRLSIVGQGPERSRLERLAWTLGLAGNVRFHGYLDKAAKEELLSAAWLAVCPSAFEGWGVVCLEANAHGIPVIASAVAGLRDAVIDGETGSLVPFGDAQALAEEIVSLSRDQARRTAMGNAGRTWAAGHTWDASADKFLELLKAIAATRGHKVGRPASIPEEASSP